MAKKTPDQIVEKYQRGVQGAGTDYANGVQNPSRSWASATAAGAARWQAGIQEAISNGAFARGVQAAGDQKWQAAAVSKGTQRYQAAAQDAANNYARVAGQVMAAAQAAQSAAANLPNATQEQRLQRAVAAMRATSAAWKSRRTG